MVVRCAVSKCTMTIDQANNSNSSITFHRFPKDANIKLEWVKRCGWKVNTNTARLCSLHFQKTDFDASRELQRKLMGTNCRRLLKKTAVPTLNIHNARLPERHVSGYNQPSLRPKKLGQIAPKPPPLIYYTSKGSMLSDLINEKSSNKNLVEMLPQHISGETLRDSPVLSEAFGQENNEDTKMLSPEDVEKSCRLCLEEKPTMWSFFSVLTFDDGAVIDVVQTFQSLTGEDTVKIENPKLPQYICEYCLDLLTNAHNFQQKYENSRKILNEYLAKEVEVNRDINVEEQGNINKSNETEEYTQDNDKTLLQRTVEFISTGDTNRLPGKTKFDFLELKKRSASHKSLKKSQYKNIIDDFLVTATTTEETDSASSNAEEINTPATTMEEIITLTVNEQTPVKLHRCPICPQEFTALELKTHCRTHKSLKSYFKSAPKYNKKVRFYANSRTENKGLFNQEKILHACPFCQEELESEPFRDHIKQHRLEGNFRCNICNRIFIGINHLKMHQLSHKKEAPYKCKVCAKSFFVKKNYDFHLIKHSDDNDLPFKCTYCSKTFSNPEHLKRHNFSHENDIAYHVFYKKEMSYVNCKQCLQKFKTLEERSIHNCKLCCAKCHQLFDGKRKFNAHVCKSKLKRSQCSPCGKVFLLPSSLKTHKFRCKKRTLCYVCGKNVRNITQHLYTHYPNRRSKTVFKCAQCLKSYSYRTNLARHITEVHLNVIRYQCQYCSKGFKGKWNLKVHERIHMGVKAHVCNICGKGFLEKSYLKKHLRVHLQCEFADPCEV